MKYSTPKMKMAVVGGAVASAAAAANGAIVYHDPVDVTISGRTEQKAFLDLTTGTFSTTEQSGVSDLVFIVGAEGTSKPYAYLDQVADSSGALVAGSGSLDGTGARVYAAPDPLTINAATQNHSTLVYNNTAVGGNNTLLGFSFVDGGTTMYGWVRVDISITPGSAWPATEDDFATVTVRDWAYETSGAPIEAGATVVPEPSSAAMMAVLAGSAALYRRRSRKEMAA